jgi:hypothetical protein
MPLCPQCKQDVRRKNDCCPKCGTELLIYKGSYYRASQGSPTLLILKRFEQLVSEQSSKKQNMIVCFHISKKTPHYARELAQAERLLVMAEGDLDLVLATLVVLFDNPQFSFKMRSSLLGIDRDFNLAMAVARAILEKLHREEQLQQSSFSQVMAKEDIFG